MKLAKRWLLWKEEWMPGKTKLKSAKCPLGFWGPVNE